MTSADKVWRIQYSRVPNTGYYNNSDLVKAPTLEIAIKILREALETPEVSIVICNVSNLGDLLV